MDGVPSAIYYLQTCLPIHRSTHPSFSMSFYATLASYTYVVSLNTLEDFKIGSFKFYLRIKTSKHATKSTGN